MEGAGDLIGNKIVVKFKKLSKNSQQNTSETVADEYDKEIPKGRYVFPEEVQEIIDEIRLKWQINT